MARLKGKAWAAAVARLQELVRASRPAQRGPLAASADSYLHSNARCATNWNPEPPVRIPSTTGQKPAAVRVPPRTMRPGEGAKPTAPKTGRAKAPGAVEPPLQPHKKEPMNESKANLTPAIIIHPPVMQHMGEGQTTQDYMRAAAKRLRSGHAVGGSNTSAMVAELLDEVARAMDWENGNPPAATVTGGGLTIGPGGIDYTKLGVVTLPPVEGMTAYDYPGNRLPGTLKVDGSIDASTMDPAATVKAQSVTPGPAEEWAQKVDAASARHADGGMLDRLSRRPKVTAPAPARGSEPLLVPIKLARPFLSVQGSPDPGSIYVDPREVVTVEPRRWSTETPADGCYVRLRGGQSHGCSEDAVDVVARINAARA